MEILERRRHFRLPKNAQIICQEIAYPLAETPEVIAQMVDVSEGGVRLGIPQPFEAGTLMRIDLKLQGWHLHTSEFLKYDDTVLSRPLTAVARVVRQRPLEDGRHEVGLEFIDIWEDHWKAMREYLKKEKKKMIQKA